MNTVFEALFEHSPIAMLLVKKDGRINLVNKHTEKLFQYNRSELVNSSIEMLVPENARSRHPELVRQYMESPLPRQMGKGRNLCGVRKDNTTFPLEVGLTPIEQDGELFILSSVIDISERIKANERFKAAFDAAPNGMLMIDSKRTIVLTNRTIEKIFGYTGDELIGRPIEILVPDDFKGHHPKFVENYLQNPTPRSMGIGRELYGRHKSGKLIAVEIGLQPVVSDNETLIISSVVDITYRKSVENQIKLKTEEIEEFAYRTSHDLRSPLKSIASMADCAAENLDEEDYSLAKENVKRIEQLSVSLVSLVEDILLLTKIDISKEEKGIFDFENFATLFKEKYAQILKENIVEVELAFLNTKPLTVQKTRLTQILDNLLGNGVKYCHSGSHRRFVKIQTFNDKKSFFIHIVDNGIGIPANKQDEVFGMFKRFHTPEFKQGSGLGLYLVKKQIAKLGAAISFESSGEGTSFYLEFQLDHTESDTSVKV